MIIEFQCPHCDKLLKTPEDKAGVTAKCPGCGEMVVVPAHQETASLIDEPSVPPVAVTAIGENPAAAGEVTKSCPMCGELLKAAATRCRYCGEDLTRGASPPLALNPHRAGLILTFGLIGLLVCFPFGIAAWVMGNHDLREMAAGRMDRWGEGQTRAGKIIGIIACAFALLMLVTQVIVIVMLILANGN